MTHFKMNFLAASVFAILSAFSAFAQNSVSGSVSYANDGKPAVGINVLARIPGKPSIIGFTTVGDDGTFSVSYKSQTDSVEVVISGINVKANSVIVRSGAENVRLTVELEAQKIREVSVSADAIEAYGDTLSYNVASFSNAKDRSIADVLKKLPGVDVKKSGEITYNGKAINKFYIEGLDMLGSRYGIASNNIQAKDVAAVEVYENHQPVKMLQNWVSSDRAAINLKLKEGAKNAWNAILEAGAGLSPALWTLEASPMMFMKKFQFIGTYKTNNTGNDVSNELRSFSRGGAASGSMRLNITAPGEPPIDESRYLDNEIHSASANTIRKVGADGDVTANVAYVHDYRVSDGSSKTTFFLPDGSELIVPESISANTVKNWASVNMQYRLNSKKAYAIENFNLEGRKYSEYGLTLAGTGATDQKLSSPYVAITNNMEMNKRVKAWRLTFKSNMDWANLPSDLSVNPTPFPEIFSTDTGSIKAVQNLHSSRFHTENTLGATFNDNGWSVMLQTNFNHMSDNMASSLVGRTEAGGRIEAADSMRNDVNFKKTDIIPHASIIYMKGMTWMIYAYLPLDFNFTSLKDKNSGVDLSARKIFFSPTLNASYSSTGLRVSGSTSYGTSFGDIWDSYPGYIMTNYRSIGNMDGRLSKRNTFNANLSVSFRNAIKGIFVTLSSNYYKSKRNMAYNTEYSGTLSRVSAIMMDNDRSSLSAGINIDKRLSVISTTVKMSGNWDRSWSDNFIQGRYESGISDMISGSLRIDSKLSKFTIFTYDGMFYRSLTKFGNYEYPGINVLRQSAALDFIAGDKFIFSFGAQHFYNSTIASGDKNIYFLDSSVSFKAGRFTYSIEGRNLLNRKTFSSKMYSAISSYSYTTDIRPASVLLKVRFALR